MANIWNGWFHLLFTNFCFKSQKVEFSMFAAFHLLFTYFSPTLSPTFTYFSPFHLLSIVLQFLGKLFAFGLGWPCETLFTYFSPTFHLLFTYFSPKKCFWRCFWWKLSAFHLNFHQNQCFWPTFHQLFTHFSPTFHLLSFDTTAWVKALPGLWFLFFFYFSPTLWAVDKVGDHFFTNF